MLGLLFGVVPGKAAFNSSVRPLFIEALIDTNLFNPSLVKCSLFFMRSTANLNNSKSIRFFVIKGYLLKCSITTNKSLIDSTLNWTKQSLPCL